MKRYLTEREVVMIFETLKRSHLKRNIMIVSVIVVIISVCIFNFTRAKYRYTQSIPLVNGIINYSLADLNIIALYQQNDSGGYDEISTVPTAGFVINEEKSYCKVSGEQDKNVKLYTNGKGEHVFSNLKKGSKCYLYFDMGGNGYKTLLENYTTLIKRDNFTSKIETVMAKTLYYEETDLGRIYYFAGNPLDNYLKFAGILWRMVGINENGSIRLIHAGNIGASAFNNGYDSNAYVGYMYNSMIVHGLTTSSTIKTFLDEWYEDNLQAFSNYIDIEVGFCGDRTPSTDSTTSNGQGGTWGTTTYYGAYIRYNAFNPSLSCLNEDLYTVKDSNVGNKALTYPIGLISMDEILYAGGVAGTGFSTYLNSNYSYWTMSPYYFSFDSAYVEVMHADNSLTPIRTDYSNYVRPVINLKSNVIITGSGTSSDPYVVKGTN